MGVVAALAGRGTFAERGYLTSTAAQADLLDCERVAARRRVPGPTSLISHLTSRIAVSRTSSRCSSCSPGESVLREKSAGESSINKAGVGTLDVRGHVLLDDEPGLRILDDPLQVPDHHVDHQSFVADTLDVVGQ